VRRILRFFRRVSLRARMVRVHAEIEAYEHFKRRYDRSMSELLRHSGNLRAEMFYLDHDFATTRIGSSLLAGHPSTREAS